MDDARFDRLAKHCADRLSRRAVIASLTGASLAAVGRDAAAKPHSRGTQAAANGKQHAAFRPAKKKKKCKAPNAPCGKKGCCHAGAQACVNGACVTAPACQFAKTADTWTLQADCTITGTLALPSGVSLDGNGKTIALSGPATSFPNGGVQGDGSTLTNLVVDGSGVVCGQPADYVALIQWGVGGWFDQVTAHDVPACGIGVRGNVTVVNSTFRGGSVVLGSGWAIRLAGGSAEAATVSGCAFRNLYRGIHVGEGVTATIEDNTFDNGFSGVYVGGEDYACSATIRRNTFTGVNGGIEISGHASGEVTDNVLVGPGPLPDIHASYGISFYQCFSCGSASGNTISNFFDSDPTVTSCGIWIDEAAERLTIGANTFPDPPGNEQDVCDNRT